MTNRNPFRSFVRTRYHERGLHQYHMAEALGVDAATASRYLAGASRMDTGELDRLAEWLELSVDERSWMMLAHDIVHAGIRVQEYIESLEVERFGNDICDDRIGKLRGVLDEIHERRSSARNLPPIFYRPKPLLEKDDDDTHGKSR